MSARASIDDWFRKPVTGSEDLNRIIALPRRVPSKEDLETLRKVMTAAYRNNKPLSTKGPQELNTIQAWALYEISKLGGLLGPIGTGHGKTGLDVLSTLALPNCKTAVLLIPAALKEQLVINYREWSVNFKVPNLAGQRTFNKNLPTIYVVTYDQLSRESGSSMLSKLSPDVIIADEAHNLKHKSSTRTRRVLRYFADNPHCRFLGWSGTLTTKSLREYGHLAALALRKASPIPLHWATLEEWANALDASVRGVPAPPGQLVRLGEPVREAFRSRLVQTPGVVATEESSIGIGLYFLERKVTVPAAVDEALNKLRESWCRPDGEELVEAIQFYRCARELASGFYYRWRFPRKESRETIDTWLAARKTWRKELRGQLSKNLPGLDSPLLCAKAAIRHFAGVPTNLPTWEAASWPEWQAVHKSVRPETEAVWLDKYLVDDAMKDLDAKTIVWYSHEAFGRELAARGLPTFGAGDTRILAEDGTRAIGASIAAHGTGKNLQSFGTNRIANYPDALAAWEQLLGRTHRPGQTADEVNVEVYRHTFELSDSIKKAREYARYVKETMGGAQKLLDASFAFDVDMGEVGL